MKMDSLILAAHCFRMGCARVRYEEGFIFCLLKGGRRRSHMKEDEERRSHMKENEERRRGNELE